MEKGIANGLVLFAHLLASMDIAATTLALFAYQPLRSCRSAAIARMAGAGLFTAGQLPGRRHPADPGAARRQPRSGIVAAGRHEAGDGALRAAPGVNPHVGRRSVGFPSLGDRRERAAECGLAGIIDFAKCTISLGLR